jgi:hypothetical protein
MKNCENKTRKSLYRHGTSKNTSNINYPKDSNANTSMIDMRYSNLGII